MSVDARIGLRLDNVRLPEGDCKGGAGERCCKQRSFLTFLLAAVLSSLAAPLVPLSGFRKGRGEICAPRAVKMTRHAVLLGSAARWKDLQPHEVHFSRWEASSCRGVRYPKPPVVPPTSPPEPGGKWFLIAWFQLISAGKVRDFFSSHWWYRAGGACANASHFLERDASVCFSSVT